MRLAHVAALAAFALLALPAFALAPHSAHLGTEAGRLAPADTTDEDDIPIALTRDEMTFSLSRLLIPVEGVNPDRLRDSFTAPRSGGRVHRAIDIAAPTGTPVLAIVDGTITRKHWNRLGGRTLYLTSADGTHDFYYAHLDAYEDGIEIGAKVRQGDVLGTVGATGNARSPHLHFQVLRKTGNGRGTPINPYPLLKRSELHTDREAVRG